MGKETRKHKKCWASLLATDNYVWGILGLNYSLQKVKSKYPLVVIVTDNVSEETINILKDNGIQYKIFPLLKDSKDKFLRLVLNRFYAFEMTDYDSVCIIDADIIVKKNIDYTFNHKTPAGRINCGGCCPEQLLIHPGDFTCQEIIDKLGIDVFDENVLSYLYGLENIDNMNEWDNTQEYVFHMYWQHIKYWDYFNAHSYESIKDLIDNKIQDIETTYPELRVFLLAAGLGTRLRPFTDSTPKCLIPINNKPLLEHWFDLLNELTCKHVWINTHYLSEQVDAFINANKDRYSFEIDSFYEKELLGSAGTIKYHQSDIISHIKGQDNFVVCYADNLTKVNLLDMMKYHRSHNGIATIGLFETDNPRGCGIVELDEGGKIVGFEEKPDNPKSNLANAGVYIFNYEIFDYLKEDKKPYDFGKDVLPKLMDKAYGYKIKEYLRDIGTLESYELVQEEIKNI